MLVLNGIVTVGFLAVAAQASAGPRWYVDASAGAGRRWGETRYLGGQTNNADGGIGVVRSATGASFELEAALELRVGAALDLYAGGLQNGVALGPELELDRALVDKWRAGVRVFGGVGGGQEALLGVRVRRAAFSFGVDAVFSRSGDGTVFTYTNGVIAGVGVDGTAAKYAVVIGAGAVALVGLLAIIALGGAGA